METEINDEPWQFSNAAKRFLIMELLAAFILIVSSKELTDIKLYYAYEYNDARVIENYQILTSACLFGSLIVGWLSDSYFGKYGVVFFLSLVASLAPLSNAVLSAASSSMNVIPTVAVFLLEVGVASILLGEGAKYALILEQIQLPYEEIKLRNYVFLILTIQLLGTFLAHLCFVVITIFPFLDPFVSILSCFAYTVYFIYLINIRKHLKTEPVQFKIFDRTCTCIIVAVYTKITSKEKKAHWLQHAENKFDRSIIVGAQRIVSIFVIMVPIFSTGLLFDTILRVVETHGNYLISALRVIHFNIFHVIIVGFSVILIAISEFALIPLLQAVKLCRTNLQCIGVSILIMTIAFLIIFGIQIKVEIDFGFTPVIGSSLTIFFNGLPSVTSIESSWLYETILGYECIIIKTPLYDDKDVQISVSESTHIHTDYEIEVKSFDMTVYVIFQSEIYRITDQKQLLAESFGTTLPRIKAVLVSNKRFGSLIFVNKKVEREVILFHEKSVTLFVESGIYNISFIDFDGVDFTLHKNSEFVEGGLYIVFTCKASTASVVSKIKNVYTQPDIEIGVLLLPIILSVIAQMNNYISTFSFMYLESPEQLRAVIISYCNFLFKFGLVLHFAPGEHYGTNPTSTESILLFCIHLIFSILFVHCSTKYNYRLAQNM